MKKKILVIFLVCIFPLYLLADNIYSITYASFKDIERAKSARDMLLRLLDGKVSKTQLQIEKQNGYNVIKLNDIRTRVLKNELVDISKKYFPDLIVRRIKTQKKLSSKTVKTSNKNTITKKSSSEFDRAIMLYNAKKYQEAYELLSQLETEGMQSEKFFFYMGRTTFELGMYSEAVSNYDELLKINPTHTRTRLEKARALFLLKEYARSKKEFETVLGMPLPLNVRKNVENYLSKIESLQKHNFFKGMLYLGFGHDTNIYNNTFLDTTQYGSLLLQNNTDEKNGAFQRAILALEHIYRFSDIENIVWNSSAMAYSNRYMDYDDQDIFLFSLSTGPQYVANQYKISLPITYDRIVYGTKEYLEIIGTAPSIEIMINEASAAKATIRYNDKRYIQQADRDKDSQYLELKLEYNRLLFGDNLASLKGIVSTEDKRRGNRLDINRNRYEVSLSYLLPLSETIKANATAGYSDSYYLVEDSFLGKREDVNSYLNLGLTKQLTSDLSAGISYSYIYNDSNINAYSYRKEVYLLNVMASF